MFPRAELAQTFLGRLADRPDRALSLFGPRQIGKTTFLTGDLAQEAKASRVLPVYVDLMAAQVPLEAINGALRDQVFGLKARRLRQSVKSVSALGVALAMDSPPEPPASADAGQQLQHLFADVLRQSGVGSVLLMLDEVQEVAKAGAQGDCALRAVRALFNQHKVSGRLLLLMTGSSQEGLTRLFSSPAQASFGLADREDFPPLGLDYVRFVTERANAGRNAKSRLQPEALYAIFINQLGDRPADLEAFIGYISTYHITDLGLGVDAFLARRYPPQDIEKRFNAFTPVQRFLLYEIALGSQQFTGRAMLDKLEQALGAGVTPSGVRKALLSLPANTVANPERGRYVIDDKLLERWLQAQQRPEAGTTMGRITGGRT